MGDWIRNLGPDRLWLLTCLICLVGGLAVYTRGAEGLKELLGQLPRLRWWEWCLLALSLSVIVWVCWIFIGGGRRDA